MCSNPFFWFQTSCKGNAMNLKLLSPIISNNNNNKKTAYQICPRCTAINPFTSTEKRYCLCCPQPSCIQKSQWRVSCGRAAHWHVRSRGVSRCLGCWVFTLWVCWAWPPCGAQRLSSLGKGLELQLVFQVNSPGNGKKAEMLLVWSETTPGYSFLQTVI